MATRLRGTSAPTTQLRAMHKIVLFVLVVWGASAQAIPLEQPVKPGGALEPGPWQQAPGAPTSSVPAEVLEQLFSGERIATLSQAVLEARSAELRDRLTKSPANAAVMHALGTVTYQLGGGKAAFALWHAAHE